MLSGKYCKAHELFCSAAVLGPRCIHPSRRQWFPLGQQRTHTLRRRPRPRSGGTRDGLTLSCATYVYRPRGGRGRGRGEGTEDLGFMV